MLKESLIHVRRPHHQLLDRTGPSAKVEIDGQTVYFFGGSDESTAEFGLISEEPGADGQHWTQILVPVPDDLAKLANTLSILGVAPSEISPSTDWNGKPLVDIDAVISELEGRPSLKIPAISLPEEDFHLIEENLTNLWAGYNYDPVDDLVLLIDARNLLSESLASIATSGLEANYRVIIFNALSVRDDHLDADWSKSNAHYFLRHLVREKVLQKHDTVGMLRRLKVHQRLNTSTFDFSLLDASGLVALNVDKDLKQRLGAFDVHGSDSPFYSGIANRK